MTFDDHVTFLGSPENLGRGGSTSGGSVSFAIYHKGHLLAHVRSGRPGETEEQSKASSGRGNAAPAARGCLGLLTGQAACRGIEERHGFPGTLRALGWGPSGPPVPAGPARRRR
jgi:hypothetical protein